MFAAHSLDPEGEIPAPSLLRDARGHSACETGGSSNPTRPMPAPIARRPCFLIVPHHDEAHFNVFLRADRFYVGTPNVDAEKLARWKKRERSVMRSGGTATLWPCCDSATQQEAEDTVMSVWLDIKYPRMTGAEPLADAQLN